MGNNIGYVVILIGIALMLGQMGSRIITDNQYNAEIYNYWSLSEKASTLDVKSEYLDKFVVALDTAGLQGKYDAVFLKNPDNSFDKNLEVLKSLQTRFHEIKSMNVSSFEYQQALYQITAQEQGEAKKMLDVFKGTWYLEKHTWLWDWIAGVWFMLWIVIMLFGVIII